MGHVDCVVWLKPPWSLQARDGQYSLVVGREQKSGYVRVATPLVYFISGQLFAPSDALTNIRTVPLHVLTLPVLEESSPTDPSFPLPPPSHPLLATAESELNRLLSSQSQPWILDVDLDFFSTANPFRDDFSPVRTFPYNTFFSFAAAQLSLLERLFVAIQEEYSFLEKLYRYDEPLDDSIKIVGESVRRREEQVDSLKRLWMAANEGAELTEVHLTLTDRKMVFDLRRKIGTVCGASLMKAEDIHEAGMMSDLPHHPASEPEWAGLMSATSHLLRAVFSTSRPSLVTIARSSDDGYTPPGHVDQLQDKLVGVINRLCNGQIHVQRHY
ncbi:UPF0489 protein C5orf22 homolog [Geodia barretti]|uniref:UPF0489 protein C5orf22 homolog n=1 Tax=Geodia barretti TaxID=519541 RepID=A0AA35WI97_GEOBA|nr:UPF0489 protein C5orf22 homolog [Geodia barretti]